jgi:hypothetical protein
MTLDELGENVAYCHAIKDKRVVLLVADVKKLIDVAKAAKNMQGAKSIGLRVALAKLERSDD